MDKNKTFATRAATNTLQSNSKGGDNLIFGKYSQQKLGSFPKIHCRIKTTRIAFIKISEYFNYLDRNSPTTSVRG